MSSVEEEKSGDDVFTEAFDTLAKTGELPPEVKAIEPAAEETPVAEESVEAAPDGGEQVPSEEQEPVADAASAEPVAEKKEEKPSAPPEQDLIDRLANAVKEKVQPQQQQPAQEQPQAYEPQPVLTQEDYKQLEAFEKDWPDVAKAMELRAKEQAHAIVNHTFKEWADFVKTTVNPLMSEVQELRQWRHMNELKSQVSDYGDIRDKVVEWANKQPDYLRGAYQQVIQRGSIEQVQDLINRYRAENAPPAAPAAPPVQQPKALSPAVKKAAEKLAPVQSKRSNVVRGDDPNDYDGAFEQFSRMQ